jgi:hypothetical protein
MNVVRTRRMKGPMIMLAAISLLACAGDAAAPPPVTDPDGGFSLHMQVEHAEAAREMDVLSLGWLHLAAVVRDSLGRVVPESELEQRLEWASTAPGVVVVTHNTGVAFVRRDGFTRIIVRLGRMRDSTLLTVKQTAVRAYLMPDTVVALVPGTEVLSAGAIASDTLRVGATRVDANGFGTIETFPITYSVSDPGLLTVIPEPRGDTIRVIGSRTGIGDIIVNYRGTPSTTPAQVIDKVAVMRIVIRQGEVEVIPNGISIPVGAGIVFRNETPFVLGVYSASGIPGGIWQVGPIASLGSEAQRFTEPGTFQFTLGGAAYTIVVTP